MHRWIVCIVALVGCIGVGAWLAYTLPVSDVIASGALVGAALGAVVVALLLHDFRPHPRPARVRRH
jgi:uncharacterized membrane protein YeaQ/YmgE (transglycosylase-associated protein family)